MNLDPKSFKARATISAFIVFTVLAVVLTNNSEFAVNNAILKPVMTLFDSYARWTRLEQRWSLFSPEPRRYIVQYVFHIRFRDGSTTVWQRPAPPKWGFFARYYVSDWQKFDTASNRMEDPALWPDLATWVARQFPNSKNPPVEIQLVARLADTPAPSANGSAWPASEAFHFRVQPIFTFDAVSGQVVSGVSR